MASIVDSVLHLSGLVLRVGIYGSLAVSRHVLFNAWSRRSRLGVSILIATVVGVRGTEDCLQYLAFPSAREISRPSPMALYEAPGLDTPFTRRPLQTYRSYPRRVRPNGSHCTRRALFQLARSMAPDLQLSAPAGEVRVPFQSWRQ